MIEIFDPYELRARILPAFVVVSPLIFPGLILVQVISPDLATSALAGLGLLPLIYVLSFVVRSLGKTKEPKIWASWGGAPSTRFMRPNDATFSNDIKKSIAVAVNQHFSIDLNAGQLSPLQLDQCISDAFRLVRQRVRQRDPEGLWYKQNGEYGFLRNLYASCWLWALFGGVIAITGAIGFYISSNTLLYGTILTLGILFVLLAWVMYKYALPNLLRIAADRYAEMVWISFLNIETKHRV